MTEADLKDELVKCARQELRGAVIFRHEDKYSAGIPDISITWFGTVWLEVKYAKPGLAARDLQSLTCLRLSKVGCCWHVIYYEGSRTGANRLTIIAHPDDVLKGNWLETPGERMTAGFDHQFVVSFIRRINGDHDK